MAHQAAYLNQVWQIKTALSPEKLLNLLLKIELENGRQRTAKWSSRTLDLDILYYDQLVISLPHLIVPHPRLPERRFALEPLAALCPDFLHPVSGLSQQQLLEQCPDPLPVAIYQP